MFKLTKRLKAISDLCDFADTIIDVGTDHGFVAIDLANRKMANLVIASDIKDGPLNSCRSNIDKYLCNDSSKIELILQDGISKIDKNKEIGIIIAGMGYDMMAKILSNIEDYNYKYLVLSPHTKITELIKFLDKKNIKITENKTVFEDDTYYFIVKAVKNES